MNKKQLLFEDLVNRVQSCALCPRMKSRTKVLSNLNGNIESPVVFIAEAPGRLGANKFGVPLYGDQTGRNFEYLLSSAGINRESIFITNAVLCNPRTSAGNNGRPTISELRYCSKHLIDTLNIIEPEYIVTLGGVALSALSIIKPHNISLSIYAGKIVEWNGSKVYPLFHPAPRALIHRNIAKQINDYQILASYLDNK